MNKRKCAEAIFDTLTDKHVKEFTIRYVVSQLQGSPQRAIDNVLRRIDTIGGKFEEDFSAAWEQNKEYFNSITAS